jgi:hypothetical protein
MSAISTTTRIIDGITNPVTVSLNDYTSPAVGQRYTADMAVLNEILNRTSANPTYAATTPPPLTNTDVTNAVGAIQDLQALAQTGISQSVDWGQPGTGTGPQTVYYMTAQMASNLDQVIRSLQAAGFTTSTPSVAGLQAWQGLAGAGIAALLHSSITIASSSQNDSLQSMVEVEYIGTANDIIFNNLASLQSALSLTSNVLNTLQTLQNINNMITVTGPNNLGATFSIYFNIVLAQAKASLGSAKFNAMSAGTYAIIYQFAASKYFARVSPVTTFNGNIARGATEANKLMLNMAYLSQFLPKIVSATPGQGVNEPNTLAYQINQLLTAYHDTFGGVNGSSPAIDQYNAITNWIIDGRDASATTTGVLQGQLTQTITTAESLNNTQQQQVRQYMFLFEEFYKSATNILSQITQIINKMADGIK